MTTLGSIRANKSGDGCLWSVPEMLEEVLEGYISGKNRYPKAVLILLDDDNYDPTVTRCQNYARDWGYGGFGIKIF